MRKTIAAAALFLAGLAIGVVATRSSSAAAAAPRAFELRTYYAAPGKLADLQARFRNHTVKIFERHGMTNIGYWVPQDAPDSQTKLVYLLAHPSREAAQKSWDAFRADPEWVKVRAKSEENGKLVDKLESVFLTATDFSAIQ